MIFKPRSTVPAVVALVALSCLVSADWDGTIGSGDLTTVPPRCPGLQPPIVGGNPSDSEFEEICKGAHEYPCDDQSVNLSDNGPGAIQFAPLKDIDCTKAGPTDSIDECKGQYTNCLAKAGGMGNKQVVNCWVRNGDGDAVASIGIVGACLPSPGGKKRSKWTA